MYGALGSVRVECVGVVLVVFAFSTSSNAELLHAKCEMASSKIANRRRSWPMFICSSCKCHMFYHYYYNRLYAPPHALRTSGFGSQLCCFDSGVKLSDHNANSMFWNY